MSEYQLEIKQVVDYPRCRIYRQFIQMLLSEKNIRVGGTSGLFYYTVLCCYANFRTSYKRIDGISYTIRPGEWLCRISEVSEWFRTRFHHQAVDILKELQESIYLAGVDFEESGIAEHAQSIERSHKMLKLVDSSLELLRQKHKNGETYYWILYYSFFSPQKYRNAEEIIDQLRPHILDISYPTFYRHRKDAIDALSSILWGYSSRDSVNLLQEFFPEKH